MTFICHLINLICREIKTCFCWRVPQLAVLCYPASAGCRGAAPAWASWAPLSDVSSGGAGAGPGLLELVDSGGWSYEWAWAAWAVRLASSGISGSSLTRPRLWRISEGADVRLDTWGWCHQTLECECWAWAVSTSGVTSPDLNQPVPATCSVLVSSGHDTPSQQMLRWELFGVTSDRDKWQSCGVSCEPGLGVCLFYLGAVIDNN